MSIEHKREIAFVTIHGDSSVADVVYRDIFTKDGVPMATGEVSEVFDLRSPVFEATQEGALKASGVYQKGTVLKVQMMGEDLEHTVDETEFVDVPYLIVGMLNRPDLNYTMVNQHDDAVEFVFQQESLENPELPPVSIPVTGTTGTMLKTAELPVEVKSLLQSFLS